MIQTKFSFNIYFQILLVFGIPLLIIYLFNDRITAFGQYYNEKFLIIASLFLYAWFWLILGTIKRVIKITLTRTEIIVNGLFSEKKYFLREFDGFEITSETSKGGSYEVLYLMKNKKTIIHISEFHLSNYKEVKNLIETKIENIGVVYFSLFNNWKRYF